MTQFFLILNPLLFSFHIIYVNGLKIHVEEMEETSQGLWEPEDSEEDIAVADRSLLRKKSGDPCDDWSWFGKDSTGDNPAEAQAVGWTWQTASSIRDSRTYSGSVGVMTLDQCRSNCEARWQIQMTDNGFTDGGQYSYHWTGNRRRSDNFRYRAACWRWRMSSGTANCYSYFIKNKHSPIQENFGYRRMQYEPGAHHAKDVAYMSRACAIDNMGGDPHVVNMKGESFDILDLGVFNMLSILEPLSISSEQRVLLNIDIEISRVGSDCSQAYIQKLIMYGPHILDFYKHEHMEVRARPTLEIKLNNNSWTPISAYYNSSDSSGFQALQADAEYPDYLTLLVPGMAINVDIGNWNKAATYDAQAITRKEGWSFLNIQLFGAKLMRKKGKVVMKGLLVEDDHSRFKGISNNCESFFEGKKTTTFLSGTSIH